MTVRIDIHHLVVDAAGAVDPAALQAQLQAELAARFATGTMPAGGSIDRMTTRLPGSDAALGTQLGEAIHGAVGSVGRPGARP